MVDWAKIFANSIITGLVTAVSTLAASGLNTTASIIAAVLAGVTSFLVEVQRQSQATAIAKAMAATGKAIIVEDKGSKLTIF
jgi:hypothetical protein